MQRQHFNEIIRTIEYNLQGDSYELRLSLRNGEVYTGRWAELGGAPDVIRMETQSGRIFIALTAIATVGQVGR